PDLQFSVVDVANVTTVVEAVWVGKIFAESAVSDRKRAVVMDAAAASVSVIAAESAVNDCQRAAVNEASAVTQQVISCRVITESAVHDCQRPDIVDAATAIPS